MIEAQALLELAVVVLDPPSELGEAHQRDQRRLGRQVCPPIFLTASSPEAESAIAATTFAA